MGQPIDDSALDTLFRTARTHTKWLARPVENDTLREIYDLLKWAPTSANAEPARFVFIRSKEAAARVHRTMGAATARTRLPSPSSSTVAHPNPIHTAPALRAHP